MKIISEQLQRYSNTHTAWSGDDRDAVTMLQAFLGSGGKSVRGSRLKTRWPNTDGTFELVPSPEVSRRPKRSFVVQSKGTSTPQISLDGAVHYRLRDLAFPAYVALEVTLGPRYLVPGVKYGEARAGARILEVHFPQVSRVARF